jgi:two-component system, OmpR family, response regulator
MRLSVRARMLEAQHLNPMPHILVVDDARDIRDPLVRYLTQNGYRATAADGAASARRVLKTNAIDLIVLDIMMPGEDGLAFTRWIRNEAEIPVILLTARAEQVDKIIGLEMGADDYLPKPFNPRELTARIAAVLRRATAMPKAKGEKPQRIKFDRWTLDTGQRELIGPDGVASPLSSGEYKLLIALMERPGMSLTRDQLLDITQGRNADSFDRAIDNAVSRLRRKIEIDPKNPRIIKTVWGGGYVFVAEVAGA